MTIYDFKPTAYANFATAAPATRQSENSMAGNEIGAGGVLAGLMQRIRHNAQNNPTVIRFLP
jgi:hypothetical protein